MTRVEAIQHLQDRPAGIMRFIEGLNAAPRDEHPFLAAVAVEYLTPEDLTAIASDQSNPAYVNIIASMHILGAAATGYYGALPMKLLSCQFTYSQGFELSKEIAEDYTQPNWVCVLAQCIHERFIAENS